MTAPDRYTITFMDFDPLPQQRLAIEAPLGPTLVVAGPGAGKTFCLIRRVNHVITALDFDPARICAVTFTNRAAEEIALRPCTPCACRSSANTPRPPGCAEASGWLTRRINGSFLDASAYTPSVGGRSSPSSADDDCRATA